MLIVELDKVRCSICNGHIKPLRNSVGEVVWDQGNNAQPVNNGRCCDQCNWEVVIPARMRRH